MISPITMETFSTARYATVAALVTVALLAAVATFNAVVDPFGMNLLIEAKGFNTIKPGIYTRVRLFKAYEVMRVRPQSLILGTSRSHIGFSCSHEAWARMEGPCYNLAFDGATPREMYWYLRHAYAVRPLKHVLLGLEPYQLGDDLSTTHLNFDPLVLRDPDGDMLPHWLTGDLRILTSMDTLEASVETLQDQYDTTPTWFGPDGQRLGDVFFRQVDGRFSQLSPRSYFRMTDEEAVTYATEWKIAARHNHAPMRASPPVDPNETSLGYVRRIVAFCRSHHIDLRIIVTPAHVHQLEILAAIEGPTSAERKKRDLVRVVDEENARYLQQPPTPIFDFSGYSSITEEGTPAPGSSAELRYYWDSSHFKQLVGDYILDRVYGVSNVARQAPPDFGVQLTDATIGPYLADQRQRQADYRRRFPSEFARLRQLVSNALNNDHG
jgi:hypothetical protein